MLLWNFEFIVRFFGTFIDYFNLYSNQTQGWFYYLCLTCSLFCIITKQKWDLEILIFHFQTLYFLGATAAMTIRCNRPLTLTYSKNEGDILKESRYILPNSHGIRHGLGTLFTIDPAFINIQHINHSEKTTCEEIRSSTLSNYHVTLAESASCPWYYRKNIDENRVPREFMEAKCACKCSVHSRNCARTTCREVYRYVTVLRRTSCTEVAEVIEPIAVGCTEVRHRPRGNPFALDD